ncbi:hypothetical protein MOV74_07455 [Bradyrhizobium sp. SHOUNA76]|nr:hypothetical protein [Bradyrhizobium sp. SHOUNA76]
MDWQFLGEDGAKCEADRAAQGHHDAVKLSQLAVMPLPPMMVASPASALNNAVVRNTVLGEKPTGNRSPHRHGIADQRDFAGGVN